MSSDSDVKGCEFCRMEVVVARNDQDRDGVYYEWNRRYGGLVKFNRVSYDRVDFGDEDLCPICGTPFGLTKFDRNRVCMDILGEDCCLNCVHFVVRETGGCRLDFNKVRGRRFESLCTLGGCDRPIVDSTFNVCSAYVERDKCDGGFYNILLRDPFGRRFEREYTFDRIQDRDLEISYSHCLFSREEVRQDLYDYLAREFFLRMHGRWKDDFIFWVMEQRGVEDEK